MHELFVPVDGYAPRASIPARSRAGDAGYDLSCQERTVILHGRVAKVRTGLRFNVPPGYVALIHERSGHGSRGIFTLANVIDSGYRGEVHVVLANLGEDVVLMPGDRVAQAVVVPCLMLGPEGPARGEAGFGSTGTRAGLEDHDQTQDIRDANRAPDNPAADGCAAHGVYPCRICSGVDA